MSRARAKSPSLLKPISAEAVAIARNVIMRPPVTPLAVVLALSAGDPIRPGIIPLSIVHEPAYLATADFSKLKLPNLDVRKLRADKITGNW